MHNFDTDGLLPEISFDSVTHIQEVLDAGATEHQVFDVFSVLAERCLENLGEIYRMNCDSMQENLVAIAASFGATLVSRDWTMDHSREPA